MVKLSKIYIMMLCAAVVMTGCAQSQREKKAAVVAEPVDETEVAEEIEPEEAVEEVKLHPVTEGTIDYLSVEGISLEPGMEIAMVATNSQNSFYNIVKKGASAAVEDLNTALGYTGKDKVTFSYAAPKTEDVIDQINIIDQFLDKAPDALCIAFSDATASKTQMEMAKNNGVKLIAFDTPDDSRASETLVATDNIAAASGAASKMFNAVNYNGKIAVIVHNSLKQTGRDRYHAITNELQQNYANKDLRLVDVVYLAQDERTAKEIFDDLLEKNPDLGGIICTDLETTEAAIEYAKGLEEKTFSIVGFDISEKIASAISDGTIIGTVAQDSYGIGYATIVAAARSIAGMENAENIHTDHLWIDSSNLDSKEAQSLLNN